MSHWCCCCTSMWNEKMCIFIYFFLLFMLPFFFSSTFREQKESVWYTHIFFISCTSLRIKKNIIIILSRDIERLGREKFEFSRNSFVLAFFIFYFFKNINDITNWTSFCNKNNFMLRLVSHLVLVYFFFFVLWRYKTRGKFLWK